MTSIIQKKPPVPRPPVRPPVTPPVRPPVRPPVTPRPGPIRADDTGRVPPSERPVKPPVMPSRPGPIRADDTGRVPPSERNIATRGGTPATVRDAPGYRGIGTPTMPSSSMLGAKKGGAVTTCKISTAAKSKKKSNW